MRLIQHLRRHPFVWAYVGALIPAVAMALAQPIWNRVDEAQHTDFVIQLSHGVYPVADRTLIAPETLRVMQSTGAYGIQGPGTYPRPDVADMSAPPPGMSRKANAAWTARHLWALSYAAAEPPLYYALMVPVWVVADRAAGTIAAVYVLRLINAALVALLAPIAAAVAGQVLAGRVEAVVAAAALAALLPGLALDGTRVSNDALSAALGGLIVWLAVSRSGSGWSWRLSVATGALMGAAILAKPLVAGLAPAVAVAMLAPASGAGFPSRLGRLAVATAVGLVCVTPWLLFNVHTYGDPLGAERIGRLFSALPLPATPGFIVVNAAFFVVTFWGGEPLDALPEASGAIAVGVMLAVVAAAGLIVGRKRLAARLPVGVCLASVAGLLLVAFLLPATSIASSHGRYLYPGLPGFAALIAAGLLTAVAAPVVRRGLLGLYVATAALALGSGLVAWAGSAATEPATDAPPASATLSPVSAAGASGALTVRIDEVARDDAHHAIWLHVSAFNDGAQEVDWTVTPTVTAGTASATADYSRSTKMPGDLDAGQTTSGWIFLGLDLTPMTPGTRLVIRFPDVAPESYRSVGDIVLTVPLS